MNKSELAAYLESKAGGCMLSKADVIRITGVSRDVVDNSIYLSGIQPAVGKKYFHKDIASALCDYDNKRYELTRRARA